MTVYRKKGSTEAYKEFLLLSKTTIEDSNVILFVSIDNINNQFTVRKIKTKKPIDNVKWELYQGYTFPSSLLNEFIRS